MAYGQPQAWYVHSGNGSTTGYYAIAQYSNKAWSAGQLVRPLTAQTVGNERTYVCTTAGTSTAEPTWAFTKGVLQTATGGVVFQECSGEPGLNGDISAADCPQWAVSSTPALGRVIYDPTSSSLQICTVSAAGAASKPTFSATVGVVTSDGATAKWTSLGPVSNWGAFAAPAPRLSVAIAAGWGAAGNDFYVADNSAETSSVQLVVNVGTITSPCRFFSVDHTASMPPNAAALKAGASFSTSFTGTGAISLCNAAQTENYWFGFNFALTGAINGVGIVFCSNTSARVRCENCTFTLAAGTIAATTISVGSGSTFPGMAEFVNSSFGFTNASQFIYWVNGFHSWRNTPDPCFTGTVGGTPIHCFTNGPADVLFEGVDFTSVGSNTLFSTASAGTFFTLKNCKMNTGGVVGAFGALMAAQQIDLINCDSGSVIIRNERYNLYGILITSTALYRNGGAVDGGVPVAQRITASSFCRPQRPFIGFPLMIWNDTVGSPVTITLYAILNGTASLPNNGQVWFDVEYMGDAGSPLASFAGCGLLTQLTPPTTWTTDAVSVWTGVAGTKAQFAMSVTVTPRQKGYLTIYPKAGTSGQVYIDPKPVLS